MSAVLDFPDTVISYCPWETEYPGMPPYRIWAGTGRRDCPAADFSSAVNRLQLLGI